MNIQATDSVGSIVVQDVRAAKILSNYDLDFCCGGDKTLERVCRESNVSLADVMRELKALEGAGYIDSPDFAAMKLDDLTLYIENVHHRYTADSISFIKLGLERLVRVHSIQHPEVIVVKRIFDDMAGHLTVHMKKEELVETHPGYAIAKDQMSGFGGIISFELKKNKPGVDGFLNGLSLIKPALSLGGVESLICVPARTSHSSLSPYKRRGIGIKDNLIRLSVGIEAISDILSDLKCALRH